jgi:DNA-binding LacI/PurR family transcriptional regulator
VIDGPLLLARYPSSAGTEMHEERRAMARSQRTRVTSADVATRVGVSRATVSYVLNDVPNKAISSQTRQAIMKAAEDLGYTPFGPARSLARGRSDIVLLVMPNWPISERIIELLDGLESTLAEHGLALVVHRQVRANEKVAEVWQSIGPAGVIGMAAFNEDEAQAMRRAGIAVARTVHEPASEGSGAGVLHVPQVAFGQAQARHLAATGHRDIGYAYPSDPRVRAYADARLSGARRVCRSAGLRPPRVEKMTATADSAILAIKGWLEANPAITAIAAYNDQWALAILAGLHALKVRVPHDVVVIGVDNDSVGVLTTPTLTTVTLDWGFAANYLSNTILRTLAGERPEADHLELPTHVIVRQSAP